jgi:hypothetical protein
MPLPDALLYQFTARHPHEILRTLSGYAVEKHYWPSVELHLISGRALGGRLIKVESARNEESVLLRCDTEGGIGVAYVALRDVVAVTVIDALRTASVLSDGCVPDADGIPAPSRLELMREADAIARALHDDCGLDVTFVVEWQRLDGAAPGPQKNVRALLEALATCIRSTVKDEHGRAAWRTIRTVVVRHDSHADYDLTREQDALRVVADFSRSLPLGFSARLDKKVNDAL